jgi:ubiquinol-cytochrome c reductase cytochrome c1 subunit
MSVRTHLSSLLGVAAGAVIAVGLVAGPTAPADAAEGVAVPAQNWSFDGVFGTFDRASAQRGFQVYKNVCAGCHSLKFIHFRNLADLGFSEDEVKAIAAEYTVMDGPNDEGEMFERAALPSDRFPSPFANDQAARAGNNGALPPDLSLIVEARAGASDYIYALLTGYQEPPEGVTVATGMNYNAYFPGHQIAMAQPLYGDDVEYADGTAATIEQEARDVTTFLTWAAEPMLEDRKRMGVMAILFLIVMTGLLYASKRKIWAAVH